MNQLLLVGFRLSLPLQRSGCATGKVIFNTSWQIQCWNQRRDYSE